MPNTKLRHLFYNVVSADSINIYNEQPTDYIGGVAILVVGKLIHYHRLVIARPEHMFFQIMAIKYFKAHFNSYDLASEYWSALDLVNSISNFKALLVNVCIKLSE